MNDPVTLADAEGSRVTRIHCAGDGSGDDPTVLAREAHDVS